ncbi:bifunctional SDR family oxidoreductase/pyridoxal phosphate-dependent aminotransferase family protein [Kitasatospora sp. NPDC001309]|uniref:bifunctional SDR family oxidoreductase/pyridoxal phosphate-dependent aminotransferase family protein n=1 Tax=Kitasatospora sp. NPDC001309 TaxID=3364013 RepID=UPI0036B92089
MSAPALVLDAADPVVADHRIGEHPVLAAAVQADALLRALDTRSPGRSWTLEQVAFRAPLRVDGPRVELAVVTGEDGQCAVRTDGPDGPVAYSTARAHGVPLPPPRHLDTAALRAGCPDAVPLAELDAWRRASGIAYGPAYRVVRSAQRGPGRIAAVLRTAEDDPRAAAFVPPPLLDGVFQLLGLLDGGAAGACLPWYVGRIAARRRITGTVLALVELDPPAPGGPGGAVRGRATVCNQQGEVLLELDRITLKAATAGRPAPAGPAGAVEPVEPAGPAVGLIEAPGWRRTDPAPAPRAADRTVLLIAPPDTPPPGLPPVARLTPGELTQERIDAVLAEHPVHEVVYVAPRGTAGADGAAQALQGVFTLVRRLAARPPMPDLLIVTTAAHDLTGGEPVDPFATALWALARTLRAEHPRTTVRLVDLAPGEAAPPPRYTEPDLARRSGTWYAPVIEPDRSAAARPPRLRGGRFLVTGGLGGIGLRVAEFLAEEGCAHLTLVGRTAPAAGEVRQRLDRLAARCDLETVAADVRDLPERLAGAARYDGILHAAGVLRDGLARGLTPVQIGEVFDPKLGGVHALAELAARHDPPGFVALFSSVAAVRANLGQSAYAAANGYLDGYAARRRAAGEPWYSLGWGLWNVGMGEHIAARAAAHGVPALTPDDGVALLRAALRRPPAHYVLTATARAKGAPMTTTLTPTSELWPPLTAAVRKILLVDDVAREDDLLELGLDSMMAVELAAALAGTGLDVDPMVFFEHSGVGALLGHLESLPRTAAAADRPAPSPAPAPAPAPVPEPAVVAAPVPAPAPVRAGADVFVPEWDRYRDPAPHAGPAPVRKPEPRPAPAAPAARAEPAVRTEPVPAPRTRTPRRTLPGRLSGAPGGSFLERRIDALSTEDRQIVARDEYFYEPVIERAEGARIRFDGRWFLNFASYSYLGLIGHDYIDQQVLDAVERHGTGAHGVRLLAGTLQLHRELELAIADFLGAEDAVVFSSGYMANVATVGALVGAGDVVIGDVYNHASILDGYRLSGAEVITYAHNDLADLERALRKAGDRGRLVVTDAVFSMDGDIADLPGIVELCERYDAPLMVDEAHSLGVLGDTGRGITEHFGLDPARIDVKMGTLSKTVPSAGGYVAGSRDLVFALKNNARGWMFSAAATPAQVAAAKAALEVMAAAPELTRDLRARTTRYREQLRALGFDTLHSETPVVPVICRSAEQAGAMARLCQRDGLFVQPIVYPAVPRTLPRLRTIVNLAHSEADLDEALAVLARAGRACGLIP